MRKVLHYKTNYLNKSETFIDRLVRNHREFEPHILCFRERSFTEGLQVYQTPDSGFSGMINRAAFHLNLSLPFFKKIIHRVKPDVIHAHFGYDGYKMLSIANKSGIPLVVSFYGSDVSRLPHEWDWKRRYRKLAEQCPHFIAASEFMKYQMIDLGFSGEKISVVRFGLDLETFDYYEAERNPQQLMLVGRLVEKKGCEYAIRAVAHLKQSGKSYSLSIIGDGPLRTKLENLAKKLGVESQIHFKGFLPVASVLEAHHNHNILLAPSVTAEDGDMEGLPNTILEAMAKGTVVVATNHAAIPEAVTHQKTGFLVSERNPGELATIIQSISDINLNLQNIRREARKVVEKQYSVSKMIADIEFIYNRLL